MKKLPRRLFLGLFLIGSLVLSLSLVQGIRELLAIENQVKRAEQAAKDLEFEKQKLQQELKSVSSPDYKETEIRDNLLMAKPNETVVILPDITSLQTETSRATSKENITQARLEPIWKRWVSVFFPGSKKITQGESE